MSKHLERKRDGGMDLIVRLPNWVGDVCMSLPALDALGQSGARLHLLGKSWGADLLADYPAEFTSLPKGLRAAGGVVSRLPGECMLLFPKSISSALIARVGGKSPIGSASDGRSILLSHRLASAKSGHESQRYWHLARGAAQALGLPAHAFDQKVPDPVLPLSAHRREQARNLIEDLQGPLVVLCPMATGTINGLPKRWPGFNELGRKLFEQGVTLICCPGPGEEAECAMLLPMAIQMPGLKLGAYGALMAASDLVIANDSGPMHLAAASGGRVLGIFGVSDPGKFGPLGGASIGAMDAWPSVDEVMAKATSMLALPLSQSEMKSGIENGAS